MLELVGQVKLMHQSLSRGVVFEHEYENLVEGIANVPQNCESRVLTMQQQKVLLLHP